MGGYFLMGYPVWFGGQTLALQAGKDVTAGMGVMVPVAAAILLIGIGGSFVKPCIAGTVQRTHLGKATLAFGIFYTVINLGSVFGRLTAFFVRTKLGKLDTIFIVSMIAAVLAFMVVLLLYRDPETTVDPSKPKRSIAEIFFGMFKVLRSGRFVLFLVVSSGFYFIYNQVYNVLPLYVKKTVELSPAMDLYTMANPITIVLFQLLITKTFGKMPPIKSIIVGTVIIGLAMLINVAPLFMAGGVTMRVWLPLGSLFVVMTVALIAFGELFAAARLYEYIGSLAPKGQEGLFLGYANLPMAIGSLIGGPAGAWIFNRIMCAGAVKQSSGLLQLDPKAAATGWIILTLFGLGSALSLWFYNRWLQRQTA